MKRELFKIIEIETYNKCNNTCNFCPANRNVDRRVACYMEYSLIESVADQLSTIKYNGRLHLFSNNEPLLDNRIVKILEYFRKIVKDSKIILYTNGKLLNYDLFKALIDNLDLLIINNYSDKEILQENIRNIIKMSSKDDLGKTRIRMRKIDEVLTTRGGNAPNKKIENPLSISCEMPLIQMVIRSEGKASLCCQDVYGNVTLGDLKKSSLIDIWNSKEYEIVRKKIAKGRKNIEICAKCDFIWKKQYGYLL